jgi:hypothetical protein
MYNIGVKKGLKGIFLFSTTPPPPLYSEVATSPVREEIVMVGLFVG